MPRPRSKNPCIAISITIPRKLLDAIDDKLTRTDSRSKWIARACTNELVDDDFNVPDRQLFAAVHARLPDGVMKDLLLEHIIASNRDVSS